MINEDYERDYFKDIVYLQEQMLELEMEARDLMTDIRREVAKIIVIDKDKVLQDDDKHAIGVLPF